MRQASFPERYRSILRERAPFYRRLKDEERARLEGIIQVFLAEKTFIGAGGLTIDDEVRVLIAASAGRLVLHQHVSLFDRLTEIIVYPSAYKRPDEDGVFLGEAHHWGTIVLAWDSVLHGLAHPRDGQDTTLHELAHVLDRGGGHFDGTPQLRASEDYRPWARVLSEHFLRLRRGEEAELSVLDPYGAQNEAEFFAVATESYFERGAKMREVLPELHEELERFYGPERDD